MRVGLLFTAGQKYAGQVRAHLYSDGSRSKLFDPGQVGSFFIDGVWSGQSPPDKVNFHLNIPIFSHLFNKNLIRSGQKIFWIKLGQPLITAGQKYGQVMAYL